MALEQTGTVGPQTRGKLGELSAAVSRKERPRISAVSPENPIIGGELAVTGSGFTFEDNAIFVKGKIIVKSLSSADGSSLAFMIPSNIPCAADGHEACPIKVVNKNGISNAKPIKLIQADFPPEPSPTEEPPSPPRSKEDLVILSISPMYGTVGTEITLTGTGFVASDNTVVLYNSAAATIVKESITRLPSPDGKTLKFVLPATPCAVTGYHTSCVIYVTNKNGVSNNVYFMVTQNIIDVRLTQPNGGENFVQGRTSNYIRWSQGEKLVDVALVNATLTDETIHKLYTGSEISNSIMGWIATRVPVGTSNVYSPIPNQVWWEATKLWDYHHSVSWPISPGEYKILAISQNEIGEWVYQFFGDRVFYNADVSDQPFSILPSPSLSVISPNGGEKLVHGTSATISWEATSILSQAVKINLRKGGVFYRTIAESVPQSAHTGLFIYSWTPTPDIPVGSNYTIEVASAQAIDVSDAPFTIAAKSTITLVKPNGGETWFDGFPATVRWNSGNILSKAVNIDLYKGGVFQRRLASNVPQKFYAWETQSYTAGSGFNYLLTIPADIPEGNDYSLTISDSADGTTSDASDAAFSIISVPNPVAVSGRLINRFLSTALANTRLYLDGGRNYMNTGSNGEFAVSTSTASLFDSKIFGIKMAMPVGSWPSCYMNWRYDIFAAAEYPYWRDHVFDLLPDKTGIFNQGNINLGDVPMWPGIGLYFYSDKPTLAGPGVQYPDSGYGGYQILALETDLQVRVYDPITNTYALSPIIKIPLANGCTPKTLTYLQGAFKWEPYNVRSSAFLSSATVGTPVKVTSSAAGGVAPYTWGLYYGSLPPGLTLDAATGVLSGTPTTAGTYKFQIKITDANGVNGGGWPITITVK